MHEAHPDAAEDIGAFLTLAGNGMRALAQIDANAAVTALGFPLTGMRMLDPALPFVTGSSGDEMLPGGHRSQRAPGGAGAFAQAVVDADRL